MQPRFQFSHCCRSAAGSLAGLLALCGLLAGGCSLLPASGDAQLAKRLDAVLLRNASAGSVLTARVVELPAGRVLYVHEPDRSVLPASNMKLVTTAVAVDSLGPDKTLATTLAFDGENLYLIGSGDPGVGDPKISRARGGDTMSVLDDWAAALRDRGIERIPGDLRYFDGAFEALRVHPSWALDDLVHWYAAPVSGLNFNDNCIDVTVSPADAGEPVDFEVVPPVRGITIVNACVSGDVRSPTIDRVPFSDVYLLGGGCRKRKHLKSKPVGDPGAFFADALRTRLAAEGIPIEGYTVALSTAPTGLSASVIAVYETALPKVLWRTNKSSQNLFAECLLKLAGQAHDAARGFERPGSWASGQRAVRAFLLDHGIDNADVTVADGSGLSRDNRVTARLITDLLAAMFDHEYADVYRSSLAEPGSEGTLRRRMADLKGHVFAKTGYIRGVRALSGYVHTRGGEWLCFSFIYNDIPGSVKPYEKLQDQACRILVDWPENSTPTVP